MDPDVALEELRVAMQRVKEVFANYENSSVDPLVGAAKDLLDRSENLDEWMTKGGFLPSAWNKNRGTGNDEPTDRGAQAESPA